MPCSSELAEELEKVVKLVLSKLPLVAVCETEEIFYI
jgi:hypothetical protein